MIPRDPAQDSSYDRDPFWERSARFASLVKALLDDPTQKLPDDLTDAKRVAVEAEVAARRWGGGLTKGEWVCSEFG